MSCKKERLLTIIENFLGKMADVEETSSYYNNRGLSFFEEVLQGNRKLHQRVGLTKKQTRMNSNKLIREKQKLWATRNRIQMRTDKYSCSHTLNPDQNVYKGLSKMTRNWFENADGHELKDIGILPSKMSALHSSSALCMNIFQYFLDKPELACALFQSCKLIGQTDKLVAKMQFECIDYPIKIGDNTIATPNIDLVAELIYGNNKRHIIAESKYTEPYSGSHNNFLSRKYYTNKDLWTNLDLLKLYKALNIDNVDEIKTNISGEIEKGKFVFSYNYLNATQLLKHLLGAACTFNKDKSNILLVYLWYDAWGKEGDFHRNEIEDFRHIVEENTPIKVRHITYQELIVNLWNKLDHNEHSEYLNYIADRYL